MRKKILITIPTMVNVAGLGKCLGSIKTQHSHDILIVNNWDDEDMVEYTEHLRKKGIEVLDYPDNPGVAFAWNRGLERMAAGRYEYCLMPNDDVVFSAGTIDALVGAAERDRELSVVFSNVGWSCFLITPRAVERVGTFDENIVGAYLEDVDYIHRLVKLGERYFTLYEHGVEHAENSTTIKSSPVLRRLNDLTHRFNFGYMLKKWNLPQERIRETPTWDHPYNDPALTPREWKRFELDIANIIEKRRRLRGEMEMGGVRV